MGSGGVGLRNRSGLQIRRQPRAPIPRGAGFAPARPGAKSRKSKRQSILAVGLHDGALPASLGDGQLSGALGTIGEIHDLLAQLVITSLLAEAGQSLVTCSCSTFCAAAALEGARPAAEKHNVCGSSCSSRGAGGAA